MSNKGYPPFGKSEADCRVAYFKKFDGIQECHRVGIAISANDPKACFLYISSTTSNECEWRSAGDLSRAIQEKLTLEGFRQVESVYEQLEIVNKYGNIVDVDGTPLNPRPMLFYVVPQGMTHEEAFDIGTQAVKDYCEPDRLNQHNAFADKEYYADLHWKSYGSAVEGYQPPQADVVPGTVEEMTEIRGLA